MRRVWLSSLVDTTHAFICSCTVAVTAMKAALAMTSLHDKDIAHGLGLAFTRLSLQCDHACS